MERSEVQVRAVYAGVGLAVALLLGIYFVYPIRAAVLVSLLTLLFAIVLSAPVDYLARRGLGRAWGLLAVLVFLFLALQVVGLAVAPITVQAQQLVGDLPGLLIEAQDLAERLPYGLGAGLGPFLDPDRLPGALQGSGLSVTTILDAGSGAANALSLGVVVLLTGVFAVLRPAPLVNGFVALFPAGRRSRVREVLREMYRTVQRWFLGQLTDMAIVGVSSSLALWILGVPFAGLLGLLSGLLGFVPYVGFAVSLVPPVLLALADDPVKALWVVAAYVLIQQIEGDVIYPLVMSRAVSLHPAVVVFGLFVTGLLFGFAGLLLAVPLVAALQVLVRELWVTRMDRAGTDTDPPDKKPPKKEGTVLRRAMRVIRRFQFK